MLAVALACPVGGGEEREVDRKNKKLSDRCYWQADFRFKKFSFRRYQPNIAVDGCLWDRFFFLVFWNLSILKEKKWVSGSDLGQHLLEKISSRCRIRSGVFSCAPHTRFGEINDSVTKY